MSQTQTADEFVASYMGELDTKLRKTGMHAFAQHNRQTLADLLMTNMTPPMVIDRHEMREALLRHLK
jgi:hypothetical protein